MNYGEAVNGFENWFSDDNNFEIVKTDGAESSYIQIGLDNLKEFEPELCKYLKNNFDKALDAAEEALQGNRFSNDSVPYIKISGISNENILYPESVRAGNVGQLIGIKGFISDAHEFELEAESAMFECRQCGNRVEKDQTEFDELNPPYKCNCGSRKLEVVDKSLVDVQRFSIKNKLELNCRITGNVLGMKKEIIESEAIVIGQVKRRQQQKYIDVNNVVFNTGDNIVFNTDELEFSGNELPNGIDYFTDDYGKDDNINELIDSWSPEQFEKIIAQMFKLAGWRVELTSNTGDNGIDVIARKRFPVKRKYLIQCKHYAKDNSLTSDHVRNYNSLKDQEKNVDQVILITTGRFTSQAEFLGGKLPIKLVDRDGFLRMLNDSLHVEDGVLEVKYTEGLDPGFDIGDVSDNVSTKIDKVLEIIREIDDKHVDKQEVIDQALEQGISRDKTKDIIDRLKRDGEIFEPYNGQVQAI